MVLSVVAFVREHGPDAGHDREASQEQPLEGERSLNWPLWRGRRPACRPHRSRYDIWYLSCRGRSGWGRRRSPPRLARTEQVSRIRSGWPRTSPTSRACTFPADPARSSGRNNGAGLPGLARGGTQAAPGRALAQKAPQCRHNPEVARRVTGSTDWRLVAGVDDRGDKMQEPQIHCCCPVWCPDLGSHSAGPPIRPTQPSVVVKTASYARGLAVKAIYRRVVRQMRRDHDG